MRDACTHGEGERERGGREREREGENGSLCGGDNTKLMSNI